MANHELVSMAQQFSGLPMNDLIGGPLEAAARANGAMAVTQSKFMLDTCFSTKTEADENGKDKTTYEPIMIKMSLTRGVITPGVITEGSSDEPEPTIQMITTTFDLPLLTIMPLNSLAVDEVDINFEMEVKSSFAEETSEKQQSSFAAESEFSAKFGYGMFSATVRGSVSYDQSNESEHSTHYEKSNSAKYTVKVHAGQLPLPKGVTTIIDAFSKSIEPIQMPVPTTA